MSKKPSTIADLNRPPLTRPIPRRLRGQQRRDEVARRVAALADNHQLLLIDLALTLGVAAASLPRILAVGDGPPEVGGRVQDRGHSRPWYLGVEIKAWFANRPGQGRRTGTLHVDM